MFAIHYAEGVWVACEQDGSLHSAHDSQFEAELCADLTNWLRSL